jgi:hypothetical protein
MNQNSLLFVIVIFGDHYILCTFTGPNPVSCYCSSIEKMAVKCQNFINNLFKIGDHHQYIYKIFKHFFMKLLVLWKSSNGPTKAFGPSFLLVEEQ